MTSISGDELRKQILEMSANLGLPSSFFDDSIGASSTYQAAYRNAYLEGPSYNPPEPKHVYLGMYVYVEKWPVVSNFIEKNWLVCVNEDCPRYMDESTRPLDRGYPVCPRCMQQMRNAQILKEAPIHMDILINRTLGVKCFKMVESKDKKVIVPYPEHASELGGTIVGGELTPLKGIIDALKQSEKVHEYWYVLCASLQRYEAKFQPGRGLVII